MATKDILNAVPGKKRSVLSSFLNPERILFLTLFVLSLVGIGVSDFSLKFGFWYWLAMVPVFGGASLYHEWKKQRKKGEHSGTLLSRHLFHWLGLLAVVYLVHVLQSTGRMNQEDAGLVLLLALALTVFLAGVHFNWRFAVLGIVLGTAVAVAAMVDQYFWIMTVPLLLGALVVIFWKATTSK